MSNFEKIFNKEGLVIPNYDKSDIVDLVRLLYNYCGMNFKETKSIHDLRKYVSNKKHIVLILVDGMGSDLLDKVPNKGILYKNKVLDIQTVFPTATGCVLTSFATAKYPSSTGIFGWFGYNRKLNLNYYTLLTKERKSKEDLKVNLKKIFIRPSIFNSLKKRTIVLQPNHLLNSQYTNYCASLSIRKGYSDYDEAVNIIKNEIGGEEATFTYLYIPFVDTLEHQNGPYSKPVYNEVGKIEKYIEKLLPLPNNTEIIVIADHGQIPINEVVYMEYEKLDGYKFTPKANVYDGIRVNKIVFINPSLSEKIIKKKINVKLKKWLNYLIYCDSDPSGGDEGTIRHTLMQAEKLKNNILNNYARYLGHDFQGLTLEKLRIIINEYRTRLLAKEFQKKSNLLYLDDELYNERAGRRGR